MVKIIKNMLLKFSLLYFYTDICTKQMHMSKNKSEKRTRFEKVASRRVQQILDAINRLSNCANKNHYDYSDDDVKKMMQAIKQEVKNLEAAFTAQNTAQNTFKF